MPGIQGRRTISVSQFIFAGKLAVFLQFILVILGAQGLCAQEMLRIEGQTLAGRNVVLPAAVQGNVSVLILGFSKASRVPTTAWTNKLNEEFGNQPGFTLYQIAVLEDVPRLIRGMVISGIKAGVPQNMRDHFIPLLRGESDLKKLVGYKENDDAYLITLNRDGKVVYQVHGALSDAELARLRDQLNLLLGTRN